MKNVLLLFSIVFVLASCGEDEVPQTEALFVTNCDYFPYNTGSSASLRVTIYNPALNDSMSTVTTNQLFFAGTKSMFGVDWLESVPQSPINAATGEMGMEITSLSTCETGFVETYISAFTNESEANGISQLQESEAFRLKLMPVNDLTVGDTWIGGIANARVTLEDPTQLSETVSTNTYNFELIGLDEEATVSGTTYSDVAILELIISVVSKSTITIDGESFEIDNESESLTRYYISKSFGNLRTDTYIVNPFDPSNITLSARQDFFNIEI